MVPEKKYQVNVARKTCLNMKLHVCARDPQLSSPVAVVMKCISVVISLVRV